MGVDYDRMTTSELTNTLLAANQKDLVRREALSALTRRGRVVRNSRLALAIQYVLRYPDRYDQEIMEQALDVLATDPDPDATVVLLELLEDISNSVLDNEKTASNEFRKFYYEVLISRQRPEDLEVWADMLPKLEAKAIVGLIADPAAKGIVEPLEPFVLLNRLPEPNRTKAIFFALSAVARLGSPDEQAQQAIKLLKRERDAESYRQGRKILRKQANEARKDGRREEARKLASYLREL